MEAAAGASTVVASNGPLDETFLCANLEYLASLHPPAITPVLPLLHGGAGPLPHDFTPTSPIVLQVNAVEDVSLPLAQRLRALVPAEGAEQEEKPQQGTEQQTSVEETLRAMESDEPASQRRGRRQRLLRLTLTDGFTRVIAVEDCQNGCDALRNGVALGAKLRIAAPLRIRQGALLLTTESTVHLGGFVPELQEFWMKHAAAMLEQMSGMPRRREVTGVPPNTVAPPPNESVHDQAAMAIHEPHNHHQQQQVQVQLQSAVSGSLHSNGAVVGSIPVLQLQPLSAWPSHHPPNAPFATLAIISEVTSELTMREDAVHCGGGSLLFSLLVLLTPPPPPGAEAEAIGSSTSIGDDGGLVVDLGHRFLRQVLRMDPDAFRALSASRLPDDVARLDALVESIGRELENFGVARFVLQQREADGIIEVVEATRQQSV
ncbi:apurinic/apyrimidinic endonuclease [Trypanosoma grayi]|uniref:apurinic/apyrimidinic endonuclease n=1 Tax=Trypanosoma grayi TaxID=71804 RepID=UPI0004F4BB22|nr:apurinic/apyrimidinic endonuclease [Trypanosoma grayi]KEG06854.1 apurinic/apyrimidinic endonuclease [Trypanosoma grayi]